MKRPDPVLIDAKLAAHALYAAADPTDPTPWQELRAQGVDYDHVLNLVGPICRHPATFYEDDDFAYDELGQAAFLFVVTGEDAETEIDVVSWSARHPEIFGVLLHRAALIGAWNVTNPATFSGGRPCPLWRTPLRWLQERCEGAVVLSAIPASTILARAHGQLLAENIEHGRELVRSGALRHDRLVVPTVGTMAA